MVQGWSSVLTLQRAKLMSRPPLPAGELPVSLHAQDPGLFTFRFTFKSSVPEEILRYWARLYGTHASFASAAISATAAGVKVCRALYTLSVSAGAAGLLLNVMFRAAITTSGCVRCA